MSKTIKIRQARSVIGRPQPQRDAVRSLGLRRIRHEVERQDTPAVRGLIAKVPHLVEVIDDAPAEAAVAASVDHEEEE